MERIELFRIVSGSTVWNLTGSDINQIYDSGDGEELYLSTAMSRTEVEQKREITKASVTINIPIDHPLSTFVLTSYLEQLVTMTIFKREGLSTSVFWKGRLLNIQPSNANISLIFESIFTSLRRPGLRATFQRNCRFALYGKGCNLDPESFAIPATLSNIISGVLTVSEAALQEDRFFDGGMVKASDGSLSFITKHIGNQITVQRLSRSLVREFQNTGPATPITIYPGCNHTRLVCDSKFDNVINYGGFDWIPTKNPMSGSIE